MYFWKQRHDKLSARAACGEERLQPGGPLGGRVLDALPGLSSGKIGLWRQATAARSGQDVSYSIVGMCTVHAMTRTRDTWGYMLTAFIGSECLRDDKFGSAILIAGVALLQSSHLTNQPVTVLLILEFLGILAERAEWKGWDCCGLLRRLVDVSAGLPGIRVKNNDLIPHHVVSARGLSNKGRGDDWGVLGTATKKALFWNAVCTQRVQCVAPKMSVRNAAEAAGSQAHYAALYNATEKVMLHDKLGDAGDDRGEETGGEQGLDIVGCAELAAFSYSSQS
ncbi:hypothetical protein V492_03763 [Pseudogymnoascus sp. VKM F-4246]|nr:hypothetical protein V492_03763 [Pseudogymnoascus sp. VKM F-4246]